MPFIPPPPYSTQNLKLYEIEQIPDDDQADEEWEEWDEAAFEAAFEAAARELQDTTRSAPKVVDPLTPPPRRLPKKRHPKRPLPSQIKLSGDDERRTPPAAGPFFEGQVAHVPSQDSRENVPRPPSPISLPHVLLSDIVGPEPPPPPRNVPRRMRPRPTSTNSTYLPPPEPEDSLPPPHLTFDPSIAYNGSEPYNIQPPPQPYNHTSLYKYIFLSTCMRSTAHLVVPAQRLALIYHRVRSLCQPINSPRM